MISNFHIFVLVLCLLFCVLTRKLLASVNISCLVQMLLGGGGEGGGGGGAFLTELQKPESGSRPFVFTFDP